MNGNIPDTFWTTQEELLLFGGACLLGIPAGVLFDVFRLLRRLIPHHTAAVAVEDMLCMTAVSVMLLCYASGFAKGVFRGYYAAGCLLGFLLYECLLGQIAVTALDKLLRLLWKPVAAAGRGFALICKKVRCRFVRYSKKRSNGQENTQNDLQKPMKIVYNISITRKKGNAYGKKKEGYRKETPFHR